MGIVDGTPDNRHHAAVALGQESVLCSWLWLQPTGIEEDDLVTQDPVDTEDVLNRRQQGNVLDFQANAASAA